MASRFPLTPKAFDVLVGLVQNGGRLTTKEDLMNKVWPDSLVEEANLTLNISALRKALGEVSDGSQYIETVPKKGYRFVVAVRELLDAPEVESSREPAPFKLAVSGQNGQDALLETFPAAPFNSPCYANGPGLGSCWNVPESWVLTLSQES
jgi:DNA-binding winged helix-turn-helix (wHTH) protein